MWTHRARRGRTLDGVMKTDTQFVFLLGLDLKHMERCFAEFRANFVQKKPNFKTCPAF